METRSPSWSIAELKALGVPFDWPPVSPQRYAALRRVSRRIADAGLQAVGFFTAGRVDARALALEIAAVLAEQVRGSVAVVVRCGSALNERDDRIRIEADHALLDIGDRIALVSPWPADQVAAGAAWLGGLLPSLRAGHHHVLVDLSGLELTGEHLAGCERMDGVLLAARPLEVRRAELAELERALPAEKYLGALLVES